MNENKPYTCFNDYPTHIQKEALKILRKRSTKILQTRHITSTHRRRNSNRTNTPIHRIIICRKQQPIHQQIKGSVGAGKTSLLTKTLEIVPERYLYRLDAASPR